VLTQSNTQPTVDEPQPNNALPVPANQGGLMMIQTTS